MLKKNIRFSSEAFAEAEAAQQWYLERSQPAGEAFLEELSHAVEQVSESPGQWPQLITAGKRSLSLDMIRKLHRNLHIPLESLVGV